MASYFQPPAPQPGLRAFLGLLARLGRRRDVRTGSASDAPAHPDLPAVPLIRPSTANPASARVNETEGMTCLDFLPFANEGDSYGSRRRVFCFVADCPPGGFR